MYIGYGNREEYALNINQGGQDGDVDGAGYRLRLIKIFFFCSTLNGHF